MDGCYVIRTQVSALVTTEIRQQLAALLPRLSRFAFALTRSRQDAEDLTQAACERALARIEQWQPDTRLDSWMFRIMQTIWLNKVRSQNVRKHHEPHLRQMAATASTVEISVEARLTLRKVAEATLDLPEEQRGVLMLVCVEGLTYREAAEVTGVPIGTVMSRLARARLSLMKAIEIPGDSVADNIIPMIAKCRS